MTRLESVQGEPLSRILKEVSPVKYHSNKQVNKLLDGSYHVQIIGGFMRTVEASIISTYSQAEKLNYLIDRGTPLVFYFQNKKFLVYINDSIKWNRINFGQGNRDKSFYEGQLEMIIKEEVSM